MIRLLAATGILLTLSACSHAGNCPALRDFPVEDQKEIARHRNSLPVESPPREAMDDWARMRAACK